VLIHVRLMPWFSDRLSPDRTSAQVDVDLPPASTVKDLIDRLAGRDSQLGAALLSTDRHALHHAVVLSHNGRLIAPARALDLVLEPGDQLVFAPAYSGGD
jgi:hypothetical protein